MGCDLILVAPGDRRLYARAGAPGDSAAVIWVEDRAEATGFACRVDAANFAAYFIIGDVGLEPRGAG